MTLKWIKKRRTVPEARAYLKARYADQGEKFPRLRQLGEARYIRVNMRAARTYCIQEVTP